MLKKMNNRLDSGQKMLEMQKYRNEGEGSARREKKKAAMV